ncbi:MAG: hypothetical protein ABSA46_15050 [Thermodesulfovibrionales bacterium]|jgi:uncharacterized protein YutE (UPF0331/DUF86 family)
MSIESPFYLGAIELLAHSVELFAEGESWKSRFVILHLAHAVEVILKDRMVDLGLSIYVSKRSQTISIWDAMEALEAQGFKIPRRPVMELLIDDRNNLQHRFGSPDGRTLKFYFDETMLFFIEFLHDNYGVRLAEALSPYLKPKMLRQIDLSTEGVKEWTPEARFAQAPQWEFLYSFGTLESVFGSLLPLLVKSRRVHPVPFADDEFPNLVALLAKEGYIADADAKELDRLKVLRNKVAHFGGAGEMVPLPHDAYKAVQRLLAGATKARNDWQARQSEDESGEQSNA